MDNFTKHYIIAALWSSMDNSDDTGGEPMDLNYSIEDIADETMQSIIEDCKDFQESNKELLQQAYILYNQSGMSSHKDAGSPEACAGHDFWLTRNGHGCGFWDRGFGSVGTELTKASKIYGGFDLYIGDDGKVYGM